METWKKALIAIVILGLIALAILIALPLFTVFFLAGVQTGVVEAPEGLYPTVKSQSLLLIGEPSQLTESILDAAVTYVTISNDVFSVNPENQLAQYDILLLDQSGQDEKYLDKESGEAINTWVKKGGNLIVVMNSGTLRQDNPELVGWSVNLDDIMPVECQRLKTGQPACLSPVTVQEAEIQGDGFDPPITVSFEVVPDAEENEQPLSLTTFDVVNTGTELAYIKDSETGRFYTAISEKKVLLGTVIYFNYDPSVSPLLFKKVLDRLS